MSIIKAYELQNGEKRYKFQVYVGIDPLTGKEKRTTRRGFKTKKEAQLALSRIQLEIDNGTFGKQIAETYQDVYDLWIEQYENTVEETTFVNVSGIFKNHILPKLGKYKIEKITVDLCQRCVNDWFKKYTDYRKFTSYASLVFTFAIKRGYIQNNPMKLVDIPRKMEKPEEEFENFYSKDELIYFLNCLEKEKNFKAYAIFRLLAFSGMRIGEALALTWNDVNFKDNEIRINKSVARGKDGRLYAKTTKTKKSIRTIKMDEKTLSILDEWRKQQKLDYLKLGYNTLKPDQLVFSNRKNQYMQTILPERWMLKIQIKYKLKKIKLHGMRHTCASLMFEAGATIKEVQDRLGHSDFKTTMDIYTHVTEKAKDEAIQKLSKYLNI